MAKSALATDLFLGFGGRVGPITSFNISVNNGGKFLYLVLYYRHLIGLQNNKK